MVVFHPKFFSSVLYFYFASINSFSIDLVNRPPSPSTTVIIIRRRLLPLSAAASYTVCHCPSLATITICCHSLPAATFHPLPLSVTAKRHHLPLSAAIVRPLLSPPLFVATSCHHLPPAVTTVNHHLQD